MGFTVMFFSLRDFPIGVNIATYGELRPNNSIRLSVNGESVPVTATATELRSAPIVLKAGRNVARFAEELDPLPRDRDGRTLGIMWKQVLIVPSDLPGE